MPPGEIDEPKSNDAVLKSGYLLRYDLLDHDGNPSRLPVLNAQYLEKGHAVVFDVIQVEYTLNSETYFIPVALIPDTLQQELETINEGAVIADDVKTKVKWDHEWDKNVKDEVKNKIKNLAQIKSGKKIKVDKNK